MSATTIAKVREISGFDDETKVPDGVVQGKIETAQAIVNSAAGVQYGLPIPYRRQNTITFSGTVTTGGTITVTINGTAYAFAVSVGDTETVAAEAFRQAAIDSTDFCVFTQGGVITIVSKTDSSDLATASAEVTIDSINMGTVVGLTETEGTIADRYPALFAELTAEIAASLLLLDNYGVEAQDTPKDGEKRMNIADEMLRRLQGTSETGLISKLFDDCTGEEIVSAALDLPEFLPNDTTDDDPDNPTAAKLGINDVW